MSDKPAVAPDAPVPPGEALDEAKQRKAAEKEQRRLEFEAKKAMMAPPKTDGDDDVKGKGTTKEERRETQERQRLEKEKRLAPPVKDVPNSRPPPKDLAAAAAALSPEGRKASIDLNRGKIPGKKASPSAGVHPAVFQLGLWTRNFRVIGSSARCTAMLLALREWMKSVAQQKNTAIFTNESFAGTKKSLSTQLSFLGECRKSSIGMGNAIRLLKQESFRISNIVPNRAEHEAYDDLCNFVDFFISEKIEFARDKIVKNALPLIQNNDVILTYVNSSVIRELLVRAGKDYGRTFHVIVVDCPPLLEGRALLAELSQIPTIQTTYCLLTSLTSTASKATKVFLGASATMSNGEILSRSGTAMVALTAKYFHIPVIGFCETYKFTSKVWLGSLTNNEELCRDGVVQYMYDLTPVSLIDVIITEYGPTPPMNVGTVMRDKSEIVS